MECLYLSEEKLIPVSGQPNQVFVWETIGMTKETLDVEHLFTLNLDVSDGARVVKNGPQGTRLVASVGGGTFSGVRLNGTVVPPGGDWVTSRNNKTMQLDVRLLLITDDDVPILMQYKGIGNLETGTVTSAPQFETGGERYLWLNDVQAIGKGTLGSDGGVSYEIYSVV